MSSYYILSRLAAGLYGDYYFNRPLAPGSYTGRSWEIQRMVDRLGANGAYVPLSESMPEECLRHIIINSACSAWGQPAW